MSLRETLVAPLLRLSWVIVLVAAAAAVAGYLASGLRAPVYTASTTMLFKDAGVGLRADGIERVLASRAQFAVSVPALERVVATVPGTRQADLVTKVTVTPDPDAFGLRVVAKAPTARRAADIADAVVASYVDGQATQAEQSAQALRSGYERRLADLDRKIAAAQTRLQQGEDRVATIQLGQFLAERLRLDSEAGTAVAAALAAGADVADTGKATVPPAPTSPRPVQDGIISSLAAALLAAGFLLERNRRAWGNVLDSADLSHVLSIPLLGEIASEPDQSLGSTSALGLAVSRLRIAAGTDGGVFVLTSTVEGVDATRAAHLLAEAAARTAWWPVALLQRTLAFGGAWGPPLAGSSEDSLGSLERGRVAPLPYGPVETAETLLVKLRDRGALVIVDGPPAQRHGDASRLVLAADAVVLVVADDQPIEAALEALEILSLLTTPVLGYIRVSTAQAALAAARRSSAVRDDVVPSGVARVAATTTHDAAVAAVDAPGADARTDPGDPADTDIADSPAPATGAASDTDGASDTGNNPDTPGADDAHDTPGTDDADDTAGVRAVTDTPSPVALAAAVADGENRTRPGMPGVVTRHPSSKDQRLSGAAPPTVDGPPGAPAVGATPGPGAGA